MASVVPDLQRLYCSAWRLSDLLPEALKLLSSLNINSVHKTQKRRKGQVKGQSQNGGVLHVELLLLLLHLTAALISLVHFLIINRIIEQLNMPTLLLIMKECG